jgi:crotonobetainyl-CoA:carnitine CoA-transferase CaiB-like acyl-CoA transferase
LADQLQSKGVAAGPLLSSSEALEYPPFVERACFTTYAIGSHEIRLPASPVRPPPLHEARAAAFAPTTKRSIVRAGGATPPLSSLRVLDMSTVIAGPYCARLLVDLGADVIKLDDRVRSPLPGARGAWSGVWSSLNAGKRSVALDLTVPAEREALRRIILGCDIVIENSRPGAIAKLGIDLDDLRRAHPGLIVASLTGFGQSGRLAGYRAFFGTTHAMSGFAHANGRGMSPPPRGGAWADFLSGTAMTWAVLAALAARQRSGVGCHLDVAMTDVMIASLGTEFAGPGERGDGVSRSWVVPCAGPDDWLAVSVPDHAAERDLAVTVSAASEAGLEQALGEWAAARGAVEAAEALASSGVPAATSTRIADIARHPQLQARAFFDLADHAGAGSRELIGSPFGVTSWPRLTGLQAPAFGEHTAEVLSEVGLPATIVTGRAEAERRGAPEAHA